MRKTFLNRWFRLRNEPKMDVPTAAALIKKYAAIQECGPTEQCEIPMPNIPAAHTVRDKLKVLLDTRIQEQKAAQAKKYAEDYFVWELLVAFGIGQGVRENKLGVGISLYTHMCPPELLQRLKTEGYDVYHEKHTGLKPEHLSVHWAPEIGLSELSANDYLFIGSLDDYERATGNKVVGTKIYKAI